MGSQITSWLAHNWLAIFGIAIGAWVTFALRPRPVIRYWIRPLDELGRSGAYTLGATFTKLSLQNVGSEPIDAKQWQVPLSVECDAAIIKIDPKVSHPDIVISGEIMHDHPQQAVLKVSHLNRGDEVAFEIQHEKIREEP